MRAGGRAGRIRHARPLGENACPFGGQKTPTILATCSMATDHPGKGRSSVATHMPSGPVVQATCAPKTGLLCNRMPVN